MTWTVTIRKKIEKRIRKLPAGVSKALVQLLREIEIYGPYRNNWHHYSPLGKDRFHCHLKKGRPTYVAVWEIRDKEIHLIEVTYVGTHEKAPY